ncbi:MAG: bifunctional precorrin-2 dehydrogenase/sirohydrochlorin ferrochelatase [Planctomycetes bacterium]|nr:bifunctional precorrin-2 dehydrogenase/sirohydrochlorin ferrochelatase [Planctomycetota bacterium]
MPKYYPINLNIQGKKCVIIGGGEVAYRKACSLKDAGAKVTVVCLKSCPELSKRTDITLIKKRYSEKDLDDTFLVIAATDDAEVNRNVFQDASKKKILVNVVDCPELCSFIVPSSVIRGDLCISISTGGASPALAKRIREDLEKTYGQEYEQYLELLSKMRNAVMSKVKDPEKRRKILQRLAESDVIELIKQHGTEKAEAEMRKKIGDISLHGMTSGSVVTDKDIEEAKDIWKKEW